MPSNKIRCVDVIDVRTGKKIFENTPVREVSDKLRRSVSMIHDCCTRKRLLNDGFQIVETGWLDKKDYFKTRPYSYSKHLRQPTEQTELNKIYAKNWYVGYLIEHLLRYGNTWMKTSPEPYVKELKRYGLLIDYSIDIDEDKDTGYLITLRRNLNEEKEA